MPSKPVIDREKSARSVGHAVTAHATTVAEAVKAELAPHLQPGEKMPNVELLLQLFARKLAADTAALVAADRAHEVELSDDAEPREARDAAAEKVREILLDLRSAVESMFGMAGLKVLGLVEPTPVDPSVLATQGDAVGKALMDGERKLPAPRRKGTKLDRSAFAAELKAEVPPLTTALDKVALEEREKEVTKRARDLALAKSDRTFMCTAWILESLAETAGMSDLAAKVKPSARRGGRTAAEDEQPEDPSGDKGGGNGPS